MFYRRLANVLPIAFFSAIFSILPISSAYAKQAVPTYPHFYLGGTIAYGQTTWSELASDDFFVEISVPSETHDSGTTWGGFMGYQFDTAFAVEAVYMRYPNTLVKISPFSFYFPLTEFVSRTQVYSVIGKFLYPLANARINAFMHAGLAFTRRSDVLAKVTRVGPTFGIGFMCNVSRRVITEVGFEYYVGYGKSEERPVDDYIPFLFSVYFRLGYRLF